MMPKPSKRSVPRTAKQTAIEAFAQERFAFLSQEKGFAFDSTHRSRYGANYYYLQVRIGVEIHLEFNPDDGGQVNLIRTESGQLLPDWQTPDVSQRWRYPVEWLLPSVPGIAADAVDHIALLSQQIVEDEPLTYDAYFIAVAEQLRQSIDYFMVQPYESLFPW